MHKSLSNKSSFTITRTVIASLLVACSFSVNAGTATSNLSVTASVNVTEWQSAPVGSYSDTVVAKVIF